MGQEEDRWVAIPPPQPFVKSLKNTLNETFFPDDPLRQFKNQPPCQKLIFGLAIPQGISYAKLANLPPILGVYSSFVSPLIYAIMRSSKGLAVGTVTVGSLLTASMLGNVVNANENPKLYLHLSFISTFFHWPLRSCSGHFQAS
ncbi:unnamed protein product [Fraxinus pennsylvanica]|uniref:SLC26A/SulP transporter domain-containing protein n=1 Tax=Fraxinus pennsylvanica TaxID=56036 RepID=A0AAD2DGT0_9LAMI|nr:unnamed protein product [Fraxinus pennsylvanica]